MDYSSYFAPPAPAYPFFGLPGKPEHPYTPQDEPQNDPLVSTVKNILAPTHHHHNSLHFS